MMGSLTRRERRPLWGILVFILAAVTGLSIWAATSDRTEAMREASSDAELAAQTELTPLLQARDLAAPVSSTRAKELAASIERSITSVSPIQDVRIFSSLGRILYASDERYVGTRPSYLRNLTFQVASGDSQTLVRDGLLQTYVPIWLNPGGAVAVAELSQPVAPISAEATAGWYRIAMIAGALLLVCFGMVVVTTRAPVRQTTPVQVYGPATGHRARNQQAAAQTPLYQHAGFRELEEQRQDAERRAGAVEENFRAVQRRLKDALAQVKELEGKLAMNESQNSTNGGELQALRDQLRDTAERLHKTELDNNALRERMSLRHQELDEARRMLAEVRAGSGSVELRRRLEAADQRASEMERVIDELERDLRSTATRFHAKRLADALHELEDDGVEIEEGDELLEHPVIIRNVSGRTTRQNAR